VSQGCVLTEQLEGEYLLLLAWLLHGLQDWTRCGKRSKIQPNSVSQGIITVMWSGSMHGGFFEAFYLAEPDHELSVKLLQLLLKASVAFLKGLNGTLHTKECWNW